MEDRFFVDINIWLYAFMDNEDSLQKTKSLDIISKYSSKIVVSTQVLLEISVNLLKKLITVEKR